MKRSLQIFLFAAMAALLFFNSAAAETIFEEEAIRKKVETFLKLKEYKKALAWIDGFLFLEPGSVALRELKMKVCIETAQLECALKA